MNFLRELVSKKLMVSAAAVGLVQSLHMSAQMGPVLPANDIADHRLADAIIASDSAETIGIAHAVCASHVATANVSHLSFCELGPAVADAAGSAALGSHVGHIVAMGTKEHVGRINASSVIAVMANEQIAGVAVSISPADAMRGRLVGPKLAIALCVESASPLPTRSKFRLMHRNRSVLVDLGPEACKRFLVHGNQPSCEPSPGRLAASRGSLASVA